MSDSSKDLDNSASETLGTPDYAVENDYSPISVRSESNYSIAANTPSSMSETHLASAQNVEINAAAQSDSEPGMMTVVEHLEELRLRLFRCIGYIAAGCILGLFLSKDIMRVLEAPAGNISFQALSLEEPVLVFFKVACYAGLVFASPFILFELSRFIAPGLTKKEGAVLTPIVIGSPILFVCGGLFAYFCLLGPMLHFFGSFGAGVAPINQRLDFYISLVSSILLYMGLCFQLPIIIFALSFTGLVNSKILISVWRYAILGASLIAAVITPDPTAISMLIVMAALIGLYFLSVLLLKIFGR